MTQSQSDGRLVFPDSPIQGDTHVHSGVEYIYDKSRWVVIPPDPLDLVQDLYVRILGDTMSGSLDCPMFTGNYDIEALRPLPL
jgi:hypothetical protein